MTSTAYDDQHAPEPTPAEEDAWRELEQRQSTVKESLTPKNTGGPAFPSVNHPDIPVNNGMALRDYFAAKSIQGLLANPGGLIQTNGMNGWNWCNCSPEDAVNLAYSIADAMLKAREEA